MKIKPAQAARRSYKNWRWAQKMEAFRPYLSLAKTESSEFENNADDPNLTQLPGMSITSMTDNLEEREQSQARPGQATEYQETNIQKKRKNISTKVKESSISSVDDVINYFENKKRRTDDTDATDLIFLGYSSTVKSFSPKRQAIVKMKIAQIIMEEEIEHATEISGLPTCYLHSE